MEDAANSAVSPKPSRKNEKMIRVRSLRRYCIGIDDPVADAVSGLDQGLAEGLVDGGARVGREEAAPTARRKFSELLPAQQSGIRCNEPAFWRFLSEHKGYQVKNADDAAEAVRDACKVQSRADLNMIGGDGGKRWRALNAEFDVWMMPQ